MEARLACAHLADSPVAFWVLVFVSALRGQSEPHRLPYVVPSSRLSHDAGQRKETEFNRLAYKRDVRLVVTQR